MVGGMVSAQEDPEWTKTAGFLRIVNVVAVGEGNLNLKMAGKSYWPKGFKLGERTGGFRMRSGKIAFMLEKEGCTTSTRSIEVVKGETQTLVCYADPLRDESGRIVEWELKIARLKQREPEQGLHFTIISFCEEQELELEVLETVSEVSQMVTVAKMKARRVKIEGGLVSVHIMHRDKVVERLATDQKGNYVVMLYTDAEGAQKGVTFYDSKFVLSN